MITDQEVIELVTARTQGKKILFRRKYASGSWNWAHIGRTEQWNFVAYEYMVAPDRRMLYAEIMPSGRLIQSSLEPFSPTNGGKIVEFKEVRSE